MILGDLGATLADLGQSWADLGGGPRRSWAILGRSWADRGAILGELGRSWADLGRSQRALVPKMCCFLGRVEDMLCLADNPLSVPVF